VNYLQNLIEKWSYLLNKKNVRKYNCIIELAPGGTDKIGQALYRIGWNGKLIVVEPEHDALISTKKKYELLKINALYLQKKMNYILGSIPSNTLVIANHPLDDMIMGEMLSEKEFNDVFNNHYDKEIDATIKAWNKSSDRIDYAINNVVKQWKHLLSKSDVIFSQYKSYFFEKNNFDIPDKHALDAAKHIMKIDSYRWSK